MKNNPLVSIAIPFYNAEKFLKQAIQSVVNQTYSNWELILLDDGSTDASLAIAKGFGDSRIKIISDGKNKGLVFRLNQSVRLSQGEYYARMDSDDIMHPMRIECQLNELLAHPEIDILGTSYYSIDADNNLKYYDCLPRKCTPQYFRIVHPSIMGNRIWFLDHPYDPKYVRIEDTELWVRVINYTNIENLPQPLMFYREFGVPTFKKYMRSQLSTLKLYMIHPESHLHLFTSIRRFFFTLMKMGVCCCLFCVGRIDILISLRKKNKCIFNQDLAANDLAESIKFEN